MSWNWINVYGLGSVLLLLAPNILYAVRCGGEKNLCTNRLMNGLEQAGRYGSMFFMVVCVGGEFGFGSVSEFLCYAWGSLGILAAYWTAWALYFRKVGIPILAKKGAIAVFLAGEREVKGVLALKGALVLLPVCLFLLCGVTLRYVPLILSGVVFAAGHSYVTWKNVKEAMGGKHVF